MTFNTNTTHYGATRYHNQARGNVRFNVNNSSTPPPPPYSGIPPTGEPSNWAPTPPSPSLLSKSFRSRSLFIALVTFLVTLGLCASTLPLKYCDDPADPHVRERMRGEWAKEALEHEKQVVDREIVKAHWAWEDEQHAALRREWAHERVQHDRALEARARREEEARVRLKLFWGHVEAHQCKTYGTREYTAVLMNLPAEWELRVQACKATALEVHGIARFPKSCEDRGRGGIVGLWEIDQYEPDCNTFWNWYKDKGCTSNGSGKRRIEHYLENLPKGGDWREFCATTPARFHGMEFSGAHECFQYNLGTYGHWEIDDNNC